MEITMKEKHIPLRKCVVCGEMKPKAELVRIYKNADGSLEIDETYKLGGRGAYICRAAECIDKSERTKRIERVTGTEKNSGIYDRLRAESAGNDR